MGPFLNFFDISICIAHMHLLRGSDGPPGSPGGFKGGEVNYARGERKGEKKGGGRKKKTTSNNQEAESKSKYMSAAPETESRWKKSRWKACKEGAG